jgi:hypothetical protein
MKIVRNSPDQLILRSVPWLLGIIFAGAILGMSAAGLNGLLTGDVKFAAIMLLCGPVFMGLFFAIFIRRDDLILDRSRNLLELRHATVLGRHKVQHKLQYLSRAMVQTSNSDDGKTHRVALVLQGGMDAGVHPVTEVYTSGYGATRAVDAINDWLSLDVDSATPRA